MDFMNLSKAARWNWDDIVNDVKEDDFNKKDFLIPVKNISMDKNRIITDQFEAIMNDWAATQLFTKLGMPGRYFKNKLATDPDSSLVQDHVNHNLRILREADNTSSLLFRNRMGNGNNIIRAFLSDKYTVFDNQHLVDILTDILHKHTSDFKIVLWDVNDASFNLRVVFPKLTRNIGKTLDGKDDTHIVGVHISNSEVGKKCVEINGIIWRLICTNGLASVYKENSFVQRHIYLNHNEMFNRVAHAIGSSIKVGASMVDEIIKAKAKPITDPFDIIDKLASGETFSQKFVEDVKTNWSVEPENNVYGIVNAFTRTARDIGDADKRFEIEQFAGKVMNNLLTA